MEYLVLKGATSFSNGLRSAQMSIFYHFLPPGQSEILGRCDHLATGSRSLLATKNCQTTTGHWPPMVTYECRAGSAAQLGAANGGLEGGSSL